MTCPKHHLMWIRDRLLKVHGESALYDYMHRLQEIIDQQTVCTKRNPCEAYQIYEVKP